MDDAVVFLAALDLTGKSMDILGLEDANSLRPCGPRTRYTIVAYAVYRIFGWRISLTNREMMTRSHSVS